MYSHEFIFIPGRWVGGGKITFSSASEHIRFYTSWNIDKKTNNTILLQQKVEMQPLQNVVNNSFLLYDFSGNKFKIELESEQINKSVGSGLIDEKTIAWEFRSSEGVEGFEVYELQENGDYMFHAEYASLGQFRTIVDGRIWRKST